MYYRILFWNLFTNSKSDKTLLGRWGYHWEINKQIQKYYE